MTKRDLFIELITLIQIVIFFGLAYRRGQSNNRLLGWLLVWLTGQFSIGSGAILNLWAMRANGGLMPVLQPSVAIPVAGHHRALTEGTRLYWLCDILGPVSWRLSVGDILILFGGLLGIVAFMKVYLYWMRRI